MPAIAPYQKFATRARSKLSAPIAQDAELMTLDDGTAFADALVSDAYSMDVFVVDGNNWELLNLWIEPGEPANTFGVYKPGAITFPAGADVFAAPSADFYQSINNAVVNMGMLSFRRADIAAGISIINNTITNPIGTLTVTSLRPAGGDVFGDQWLTFYNFTSPLLTYFRLKAKIKFNPTAGGVRKAWLVKIINGVETEIDYRVIPGATDNEQTIYLESPIMRIKDAGVYDVNDKIELRVFQDSGGAINLLAGSYFELEWLNRGLAEDLI